MNVNDHMVTWTYFIHLPIRLHVTAINVKSHVVLKPYRVKKHCVRFNFLPRDAYINEFSVTPKSILRHMREHFFKSMFKAIGKAANEKYST